MARPAFVIRYSAPLLLVLIAGACGGSDDPEAAGGSGGGGMGGTGDATAGGAGAGGAGAQPDDGSDPNDIYACTGPGQCLLMDAARDCCVPKCGEQTIDFFTAIHLAHAGEWYEGQVCAGCLEPCSDEESHAFTTSTSGIIAVCNEGHCEPFDTRQSDVAACSSSDDCEVRWGSGCCEDRTENRDILTAISNPNLLKDLTCQEDFIPCGAKPAPPTGVHAVCGESGYCELAVDPPDSGLATDAGRTADAGQTADASAAADGGP